MNRETRFPTIVLLPAAALTVASVAIMPRPPSLGDETTGDAALAATVRELVGGAPEHGLSVALIENGEVRFAGLGTTGGDDPEPVDETTSYEIGSIGKALTGMLLADSGLDPDTPVSDLLPDVRFRDPAVASATLAELASHRSGLPSVRTTPASLAKAVAHRFTGIDPYVGDDRESVLADAAAATARGKGEVGYSNLGAALLGIALADNAGTSYDALLAERITEPLGMSHTVVAGTDSDLPADRAQPHRANGWRVAPWLDRGWAGAGGGQWSSAADLAVLIEAMLNASAPGAEAATPRFDAGDGDQVGYGWWTDTIDGRQITWHNGGTGGSRSFIGFDAAAGDGVVVLSNTDRSVDWIGRELLGVAAEPPGPDVPIVLMTIFLLAFTPVTMTLSRRTDRLGLLREVATGAVILVAALAFGAWDAIPAFIWVLSVAALATAAVPTVRRWPELPWLATGRRWSRTAGAVLPAVLLVALLAAFAVV